MLLTVLVLGQIATASPVSTPAPTPRPVMAAPQTLGSSAGAIKVNKAKAADLFRQDRVPSPPPPPPKASYGFDSPSPEGKTAGGPGAPPPPAPAPAASDEQVWRGKWAAARSELKAAEAELAQAEASSPSYSYSGSTKGATYAAYLAAMAARDSGLLPYRIRVDKAAAIVRAMPEECRRAGCSPGWVRD